MNNKQERDVRLDLAKAIAISLILLWHLQPLQIHVTEGTWLPFKLLRYLVNQFNYQITLVAVPLFLIVSIYLYFIKMQGQIAVYTKKRLRRLFEIFLFWTTIQSLVYLIPRFISYFQTGELDIQFPSPAFGFIMKGGLGGSVFYFLFVLLGLNILAAVYGVFWKNQRLLTVISIALIIISVLYFEFKNITYKHLPFWSIDNFLIYVPIAFLLWRDKKGILVYFIPLLFLGYLLFSTYDIYISRIGPEPGIYGRLSIVLGATALFSSILQFRSLKENKLISFLSLYSLGIFALHNYWQKIGITLIKTIERNFQVSLQTQPFDIWPLIMAISVIVLTILSLLLLRKTPLKRYIM